MNNTHWKWKPYGPYEAMYEKFYEARQDETGYDFGQGPAEKVPPPTTYSVLTLHRFFRTQFRFQIFYSMVPKNVYYIIAAPVLQTEEHAPGLSSRFNPPITRRFLQYGWHLPERQQAHDCWE